jgi:hypothetical protein
VKTWNTDKVNGHTALSIDIDIGFLTTRQIRCKAGSEETAQAFMGNIEKLRGHLRRGKVIAVAQRRDVLLVEATRRLAFLGLGRHIGVEVKVRFALSGIRVEWSA